VLALTYFQETAMTSHSNRRRSFQLIRHSFGRCCIAAILSLPVMLASSAYADIAWPPPESVQQQVVSAIELVDQLQALAPKLPNDLAAQASSLDFEFEAAIQYVTENIRYEPYSGVLRGPDGAAAVGAGNAWDQALLLAALINTMGGDAQIVSGALSEVDAYRLLEQAFVKPTEHQDGVLDDDLIAATFEDFDPELAERFREEFARFSDESARDRLVGDSVRISRELLGLILQAAPDFSAVRDVSAIVDSVVAGYVWVRWRTGPNSNWADVHPAFGTQPAPAPEPRRYFADQVLPEYQHRVALQLFIERGKDDGSSEPELVPIMSRWERPTANLYKDQIYLGMAPQSHDGTADSAVLVPALNGAIAPGAQAVTRLGLVVDPSDAASPAGKLFATLSSRTGAVAGALGGLTEDRPAEISKLLGVMLKVEILSPEEHRTIWRRVVDLRGLPDAAFPGAGAFQVILDVHVGSENALASYDSSLQYFRRFVPVVPPMLAMARDALSVEELESSAAYRDLKSPRWSDFELIESALLKPATERVTTFRDGPFVAGRRTGAMADGRLMTVTDVFWNPSTVLARSDDGIVYVSVEGAVEQGIRETLLESALAGVEPGWSARVPNAVVGDAASLETDRFAAWPVAAREAARADLDSGYLLAVTEGPSPYWWRMDPVSGQTLGMSMHGGSEILEYTITVIGTGISVFMFKRSVEGCDKTYAHDKDMADCCIVGNLALTYATAGASATGGALTASGAAVPLENAAKAATGAILSTLAWTSADIGTGVMIGARDGAGSLCRTMQGEQ
jgi:hypothetical protein